jgi:ankyrin repeat protein
MLIWAGANVDHQDGQVISLPVTQSQNRRNQLCVVRSLQVLTVLLLQSGKTALMEASDRGHTEVVQALIGAGANPNLQDEVGGDHSDAFAPINRV